MAPSKTNYLTTVTDLDKLGKVFFEFEPNRNFSWLATTLEHQFEPVLRAAKLIKCRYENEASKSTIYKTDDDEIMYYAVDPSILEETLLASIVNNTPETRIQIPTNFSGDIAPTREAVHQQLVAICSKAT